jgi:hypothetical protein
MFSVALGCAASKPALVAMRGSIALALEHTPNSIVLYGDSARVIMGFSRIEVDLQGRAKLVYGDTTLAGDLVSIDIFLPNQEDPLTGATIRATALPPLGDIMNLEVLLSPQDLLIEKVTVRSVVVVGVDSVVIRKPKVVPCTTHSPTDE